MRIYSRLVSIVVLVFILTIFASVSNFGVSDEAFGQGKGRGGGDGRPGGGQDVDDDGGVITPSAIDGCGFDPAAVPLNRQICGFAWGGDTDGGVGWVSFNSRDCDVNGDDLAGPNAPTGCPPDNTQLQKYGVGIGPHPRAGSVGHTSPEYFANKWLRGCAWSPNVGWIKFGDFKYWYSGISSSDFANVNYAKIGDDLLNRFGAGGVGDGASATSCLYTLGPPVTDWNTHGGTCGNARIFTTVNGSSLQGWARACASTPNGDCSDINENLVSANSGGWDGWIALAGFQAGATQGQPPNQLRLSTSNGVHTILFNQVNKTFSGYSWGGDVLGWLKWGPMTDGSGANWANGVHLCDVSLFDFIMTVNPDQDSFENGTGGRLDNVVLTTTKTVAAAPDKTVSFSYTVSPSPSPGTITVVPRQPSFAQPPNFLNNCTSFSSPCLRYVDVIVSSDVPANPLGPYIVDIKGINTADLIPHSVNISINVSEPMSSGILNAECLAPAEPPPYFVNEPVKWRVEVTGTPPAPVSPIYYTAVFDGTSVDGSSLESNFEISRTYSTIGKKTFFVEDIRDSSVPEPAESTSCAPPAEITISVDPEIIER